VAVDGPGKVEIKCEQNPDGTTKVLYKPTEPGKYKISIKYAGGHVPGILPKNHIRHLLTYLHRMISQ